MLGAGLDGLSLSYVWDDDKFCVDGASTLLGGGRGSAHGGRVFSRNVHCLLGRAVGRGAPSASVGENLACRGSHRRSDCDWICSWIALGLGLQGVVYGSIGRIFSIRPVKNLTFLSIFGRPKGGVKAWLFGLVRLYRKIGAPIPLTPPPNTHKSRRLDGNRLCFCSKVAWSSGPGQLVFEIQIEV